MDGTKDGSSHRGMSMVDNEGERRWHMEGEKVEEVVYGG
jgi:hypothetical protein